MRIKFILTFDLIDFDLSLSLALEGNEERQEAHHGREERIVANYDVDINCS